MPFESPGYLLDALRQIVAEALIQLPDFQRDAEWEDSRIKIPFASISLSRLQPSRPEGIPRSGSVMRGSGR